MFFVSRHRRQPDGEPRALIVAATLGPCSATVQLNQVADDRETESETTVVPGCLAILLAETIEDVRQKIALDTHAGVVHDDLNVRIDPLQRNLDQPALASELHAIRKQVPNDLLQSLTIAKHWT